ncbi:MAG: BON domain-containing protein [Bryobacteraceae bacterium]|nr:BON domain-containing protein [Bryobacteraceae bacterium]
MRFLSVLTLAAGLALAQGNPVDDRIYDEVRRKMANDRDVGGGVIEVIVRNGEVTLKGRVRKDNMKAKAEKIARKVKGVTTVTNQIEVRLTP